MKKLYDLETGKVVKIKKFRDQQIEQRLIELGFLIDNSIEVIRKAPFNGPICVKIDNSLMCIRKNVAKSIEVEEFT